MDPRLKNFKNRHEGETAVLFASGPSLSLYKRSVIPEGKFVSVGVNSVIFNDSIKLDYYFCGDDPEKRYGEEHPHRKLFPLTQAETTARRSVTTFCVVSVDGLWPGPSGLLFSKEDVAKMQAIPIELSTASGPENFRKDIVSGPMYNHSIVFPAVQFLLYAGIKRLYLVGHDQGGKHAYFYTDGDDWGDNQIWNWHEFKRFQEKEYPEVEVISVNPVNLKGLFKDVKL